MNSVDVNSVGSLIVIGLIVFALMSYFDRQRRRSLYNKYLEDVQKISDSSGDYSGRSLELQKEMVVKLTEIKTLLEDRKA